MGFAASQARLLLLTARKSDLEFRAQQITNAEMILAMQTEEVAREYSNKLSNQTVKFNGAKGEEAFTASTLATVTAGGLRLQVYNQEEGTWHNWNSSSDADFTGPEILQMLNQGTAKIFDNDGNEIDINSTQLVVAYYTEDDAAADAEYRRKTAALQVKEKRLQMELQQVEAQQKACDTEIESVKKIMDKNIEKTFKVFS